jgi:hypothetical protein
MNKIHIHSIYGHRKNEKEERKTLTTSNQPGNSQASVDVIIKIATSNGGKWN